MVAKSRLWQRLTETMQDPAAIAKQGMRVGNFAAVVINACCVRVAAAWPA